MISDFSVDLSSVLGLQLLDFVVESTLQEVVQKVVHAQPGIDRGSLEMYSHLHLFQSRGLLLLEN